MLLRKTLKLLAAICCFSEEAMQAVSLAFERLQQVRSEESKYGILATILGSSTDVHLLVNPHFRILLTPQTYCLSLINALVNMPSNSDHRISIRNEFISLGILATIEVSCMDEKLTCVQSLKMAHHYDLDTQINVFVEEMNEDSKIVQQRKSQVPEAPKAAPVILYPPFDHLSFLFVLNNQFSVTERHYKNLQRNLLVWESQRVSIR